MMKSFHMFTAAFLLLFSGSAFSDAVQIVNLDLGDTVDGEGFTIEAQAGGFNACDMLELRLRVVNHSDGKVSHLTFGEDGLSFAPNMSNVSNLSLVNELGTTVRCSPTDPFEIILIAEEYEPNQLLGIYVQIKNKSTGLLTGDIIHVTTR